MLEECGGVRRLPVATAVKAAPVVPCRAIVAQVARPCKTLIMEGRPVPSQTPQPSKRLQPHPAENTAAKIARLCAPPVPKLRLAVLWPQSSALWSGSLTMLVMERATMNRDPAWYFHSRSIRQAPMLTLLHLRLNPLPHRKPHQKLLQPRQWPHQYHRPNQKRLLPRILVRTNVSY